jgi:hypothetical protein
MEGSQAPFPLGPNGRLEAGPMTNAVGNHAILVREGEQPRALVTVEEGSADRHRVVVVPLDTDVELRVDGDALAIWLSQGSVGPAPSSVPAWANAIGFALVILAVGFMLLGSVTFFGWLFRSLGWL